MGGRALVGDRPQSLRRGDLRGLLHCHHNRGLVLRLEDVNTDGGIGNISERVPHERPDALALQVAPEELLCSSVESAQVELEPSRSPAPHLHRREVTERRRRRPERLGPRHVSVDLDPHRSARDITHPAQPFPASEPVFCMSGGIGTRCSIH